MRRGLQCGLLGAGMLTAGSGTAAAIACLRASSKRGGSCSRKSAAENQHVCFGRLVMQRACLPNCAGVHLAAKLQCDQLTLLERALGYVAGRTVHIARASG